VGTAEEGKGKLLQKEDLCSHTDSARNQHRIKIFTEENKNSDEVLSPSIQKEIKHSVNIKKL